MRPSIPKLPNLPPGLAGLPGNIPIIGQAVQKKTGMVLVDPNSGAIFFKWNKKSRKAWCVQDLVILCTNLAKKLKEIPREGAEIDEPEGARYVQLSDSLLDEIVEALENGRQPEPEKKTA